MSSQSFTSFDVYQCRCIDTAVYPDRGNNLEYTLFGLGGEVGELLNKYKKVLRDKDGELTAEDVNAMLDELGDILWYTAMTAHELRSDLHFVANENAKKLALRKKADTLHGSGDNR